MDPIPASGIPATQFRPAELVFGTPHADATRFPGEQGYADSCAIRCQEFIIEQFTGRDVDERVLVEEATAHGWYTPGQGTALHDVGNLLELHGIPVTRQLHANSYSLAAELAQGHKVIVGVSSGELWREHPVLEGISHALGIGEADHAVVVTGIDTTDPDDVRVFVSDPGTGAAIASHPMATFLDAWSGAAFAMVATRDPAPPFAPGMDNFDYVTGHLPSVAGMPYEEFAAYGDRPEEWIAELRDDQEPALPDSADGPPASHGTTDDVLLLRLGLHDLLADGPDPHDPLGAHHGHDHGHHHGDSRHGELDQPGQDGLTGDGMDPGHVDGTAWGHAGDPGTAEELPPHDPFPGHDSGSWHHDGG